ncbi:type IX secretion system membrane protein PorP/SprF [Leptobacterium sp. I13]|uniref:PorP/SprF family type IX secretion system membrane protein n=1 Tax=Leptobacterium meishanense TaxID=3128904 RepID=UPI0030ECDCBB
MKQTIKNTILTLTVLTFAVSSYGQQDPQYTQYMYSMNIVNPAYAGSKYAISLGALGRKQWLGIDGAPEVATFFIHSPVGRNVGLGLSAIAQEIGPVKEQNIYADFSYTLDLSDQSKIAFGLKAGVTFKDIGLLSLTLVDPNDPLFVENVNSADPNIGAGVYFYTERFYLGLSVPNFIETLHFDEENGIISNASDKMHYFLTGGYVFDLSDNLKFKPSFMAKMVFGAPVSIDASANMLINEKIELGASYRVDDSVSGLVNFFITPNFRVGYAYDYSVSDLGNVNNTGSHEIFLLYDFALSRGGRRSPRFF